MVLPIQKSSSSRILLSYAVFSASLFLISPDYQFRTIFIWAAASKYRSLLPHHVTSMKSIMVPHTPTSTTHPTWRPTRKDAAVLTILSVVSFVAALDSTILVTVLPVSRQSVGNFDERLTKRQVMARDLHGSTSDAFWAGTSYLLSSAISQPIVSSLADLFGPRALLWHSVLIFTIGSVVCGLATSFTPLLAGRSVQGIGGGGSMALVQIIFSRLKIPIRERPKWFSLILAIWAVGSVAGPFIGSVLTQRASFHWAFWINLPFCGVILASAPFFINSSCPSITVFESLKRVDWIGCFTFLSSTTSFLIGLSWGGVQFPWTSPWTLCPIVIGSLGVLSTILWETKVASYPLLPMALFPNTSTLLGYICAFLHGLIVSLQSSNTLVNHRAPLTRCLSKLLCTLYYVPFYFASVRFQSPIQASVCLLPISCSLLPASAVVSRIISRTGQYRWALWSGWTMNTLGAGLLLLLDGSTPTYAWTMIFLVFGVGNGSLLSAINFSVQTSSGSRNAGRAASMYTFVRSFGMAIGVTVGGNVFQNWMARLLRHFSLSAHIAGDAEGYIQVLRNMDKTDPTRSAILQAYIHGFHAVFVVLLGASAIGLVVSGFIGSYSMTYVSGDEFVSR